jgi:hypothetical protein
MGAIIAILVVPGSAGALLTLGVTTKSPQDVAPRSATLAAEATVSVLGASIHWEYGTTTAYGSTTGSVSTSLIGVKETVTLPLSGLAPETTYHVRAVAMGGLTTAYGRDVSFKTSKAKSSDDGGSTTTPGTAPGGGSSSDDPGTDTSGGGSSGSGTGSSSDDDTTSSPTTSTSSHTGKDSTSTTGGSDDADDGFDDVDTPPSTDPAADVPRGQATAAVTPVLGKTLAVAAVQGTVTAIGPDGAPLDLSAAKAVPTGTVIDARAGTVELTSALDRDGATQTGRFWGGRFEVRQSARGNGLTQLVLRGGDFGACRGQGRVARAAVATATAAAKKKARKKKAKKPSRSLWGSDDHGRFQTHGRGSVATVRGTRWLTQDTCAGTLTRVAAGAVAVKDLRTHRTVVVRAGRQYRARVAP